MNHYPRHVGDITRDTFGLSPTEFGCYDRMLDHYYASEAPLPLDMDEIHRIVGARTPADRKAAGYVLRRYFTEGPDGWHQKRCDAELERYRARADSARTNGRNGGRPRNQTETDQVSKHKPNRFPDGTERKTNQEPEPVTNNLNGGQSEPPTPEALTLPGTLTPATWREWKGHLANKRRGLTPQAERLQLAQLRGHADAEAVVLNAIRKGNVSLEPVGGWPDKPNSVHNRRAATAAAMYGTTSTHTEAFNAEPTDITAESKRIA